MKMIWKGKKKIPDKTLWEKDFQRCRWVCFVFVIYCWVWGLPLRMVCTPSNTPLEKTNYSFARDYQLEIDSRLGMGSCVHFFFQCQDPIWYRSVQPWAHCHISVSSHMHCYAVFRRPCLFDILCPLWLLEYFCLLFFRLPRAPEGRDLMKTFHLGLLVSMSLTLFILSSCGSLFLFSSTVRRSFLNDAWARHWSTSIGECY